MLGGGNQGGGPSSPGVAQAAAHPRLVGSPEGGSRPNARAAASGLLVEAGMYFSRIAIAQCVLFSM